MEEPKDVPPWTATASPQPENAVEDSQPFVGSADPKTVLNVSERAADEALGHHLGPTVGAPDQTKSSAEHELLDRAIGMIRSALEKRAE